MATVNEFTKTSIGKQKNASHIMRKGVEEAMFEHTIPVRVRQETLEAYCVNIFQCCGMERQDALLVSRTLVHADLVGMDSHGVMRVPAYVSRLENGGTLPKIKIEIIKESSTTALIDGHNGMGQVISVQAMDLCIRKAKEQGVAWVSVRGSNHFGMASYYSEMALAHDMIGIVFTSPAALLIAPTGGIDPILDNNPFTFAVPAGEEYPVVLDMATSVVSRGKIAAAAKRGEKIPLEWAMSREGHPTDDPQLAFDGILLPMGGYKGYGITVVVGILAAVLGGGNILSTEVKDFYRDVKDPQNIGHLFGAIRIDRFQDTASFKAKMDSMIREIKSSRLAPGAKEILLPGEREFRNKAQNATLGVPITPSVYNDLLAVGKRFGAGSLEVKQ